jgi:hypothetical protein
MPSVALKITSNVSFSLLLLLFLLQKYKNNLRILLYINFISYLCSQFYDTIDMRQLKTLLVSLLLTAGANGYAQGLVINELMQSNVDCTMDNINEFPDSWVELYNNSDQAINLQDYKIGIESEKTWQLPDKKIEAKGFVLVYCDKEEVGLHTDFRLETGKGCVCYLFKGNEIVDSLPAGMKKMPAPNIAYGRKTEGSNEWGYQLEPTPGKENCGEICDENHILGEPVFSELGHVMTTSETIKLTLSLPKDAPEGTKIYYTTDGREPTKQSTLYTEEIEIDDSRAIRAKLFCDGWLSPRSTVHSYIMLDREMTIPVISIVTNDTYLNGTKVGIFKNNSKANQNNWRRPINFELFDEPNKNSVLNQICETRVMGGQSRDWARKSMAIYANKRFGAKRLEYEFFPDQRPGVTNFKSIMLRNAGNDIDGLYMRDAIIQRTMAENADLDWQAWRPAAIYINGEYHCMLNIRERSNDDNIFTNYNGLEDIDMVEIAQDNNKLVGELKAGTSDNYDKFVEFYSQKGHTLAEYAEWIDWKEYINLMAMNLYFNNQDFPGNNIVMWRPRTEDGKWRWISKDTDFGLGLYGSQASENTIKWIYSPGTTNTWANTEEATRLFRNLMEDPDFNREFIDRSLIYMGDFLNEKGVREIWDPMFELAKAELLVHRDELNPPSPWGGWWGGGNNENSINSEVNNVRKWLSQRTDIFRKDLCNYYKVGTLAAMTVNKNMENAAEGHFLFNGVELTKGSFDGKFIIGRKITLEPGEESALNITGWEVVADGTTTNYQGAKLELDMPQCKNLAISALFNTTGISAITTDNNTQNVYDLNGRMVRSGSTSLEGLPRGIYIVGGRKVVK